jgi:ATP-binding cassette, subfamily B, bacterial HlyB/CyaB
MAQSNVLHTESLISFLRTVPLFSMYGETELEGLLRGSALRSYKTGELICRQGEPGTSFYVVWSGQVRILMEDDNGREVNLGGLTQGDHFGESAMLTERTRNATARAIEDSVLIEFSAETFQTYFIANEGQRSYFDAFLRSTSLQRFLKSCTDFSVVPARELRSFVGSFTLEAFKEGEAVFRQGAAADKFYLIEEGKLKVVKWEKGRQSVVNFLHSGDFFGEKALIEHTERNADVVCLTDCRLASVTRDRFDAIMAGSPQLRKVIADRIVSYQTTVPPIPYQELIKQELADRQAAAARPEEGAVAEHGEPGGRVRRRITFPFLWQSDEMSCGSTCLAMIARYYGKRISANRLRDLAFVDAGGASLAGLGSAAEQLGFSCRAVRLSWTTLREVAAPCIVHWQGFHFIVVHRTSRSHVWVADPGLGMRRYTREEFCESWSGIALLLDPTEAFTRQREDRGYARDFARFLSPHRLVLFEIFLASLLLNLFGLVTPLFTQAIIDRVLGGGDTGILDIMLVGVLIIMVFRTAVALVRQYLIVHTGMKIDLRMLVFFFTHLLSLPFGYFRARKVGDFITRFAENQKVRVFMTNTALGLVLDLLMMVVYLAVMAGYDPHMTFVVLGFIPVFAAVTLAFTPVLKRRSIDAFNAQTEADSQLIESINAIETIKAAGIEGKVRARWESAFINSLNVDFTLYSAAGWFRALGELLASLATVALLWFGARRVMQGEISVGQLMAFIALAAGVITPLNRLVAAWNDIQQMRVAVDRLNDVLRADPESSTLRGGTPGLSLRSPRGEIAFDKVFFRYGGPDEPYILSNINLRVPPGGKLAIVGRSGSGKSSLVRLLVRLYDTSEGRIAIDGTDIRQLNLVSLRRSVGYVIQENTLFRASIRENVSLFDPEESLERVIDAARRANAHEFISSLAMGYESRIGEGGIQLSGGQRQRIAIARALYTDPPILVFDEATSALDTESELAIQRNLDALLAGKTAIIIAHRMSTVRDADCIVVLDNGEIAERGTHEELLARNGLYHYLSHQQLNL